MKNIKFISKINFLLWFFILSILFPQSLLAQWVQTNGPYGGKFMALAESGSNIFAGSESNAAYCSTDYGQTWDINSGLRNSADRSPTSIGSDILAGFNKSGLDCSPDDGQTWINTSLKLKIGGFMNATQLLFLPM